MADNEEDNKFDDSGSEHGKVDESIPPTVEDEPAEPAGEGTPVVEWSDMDKPTGIPASSSDAEAKLKVANMIVEPKGKYALRQMSRVSSQEEKKLILLELQTETHKLLTGNVKDKDGNPLLFGDMVLDIVARYSRAREGQLIVDCLKVIQIEGEKEEDKGGSHWG